MLKSPKSFKNYIFIRKFNKNLFNLKISIKAFIMLFLEITLPSKGAKKYATVYLKSKRPSGKCRKQTGRQLFR